MADVERHHMSLPKPYYHDERAGITIYHGDAWDVLLELDPFSPPAVVVTDPPYNVGKEYGAHNDSMEPEKYFDWLGGVFRLCEPLADSLVYFPGTRHMFDSHRVLRLTRFRIYRGLGWHKKEFAGDLFKNGPAMCWEPIVWACKEGKAPIWTKSFGTAGRDFLVVDATHGDPFKGPHPCPKPMKVMAWLVGLLVPPGHTLIDPFCGTGSSLRAAKDIGLRAIGIEREERFCEIAANRLSQGVLPGGDGGRELAQATMF